LDFYTPLHHVEAFILVALKQPLGHVWLPLFGAKIKEFIYDSNNYLSDCHGIGNGIYL
jgi:hypothetical protein